MQKLVTNSNFSGIRNFYAFRFLNNFFLQVLPEFFQVEAFAKLNSAIGKVIEINILKYIKTAIWVLECFEKKLFLYRGFSTSTL